jgi:hypothetical protein
MCERPSQDCTRIAAADCCCQPAVPLAAPVAGEMQWSGGKFQWHSPSWIDDAAGATVLPRTGSVVETPPEEPSPPRLDHPDFLTPLLI